MARKNQGNNGRGESEMRGTGTAERFSMPREEREGRDDGGMPRRRREGSQMPAYQQISSQHPLAMVVGAFGAGLGLGLLVTIALSQRDRSWMERHHIPDSMHDLASSLKRVPGMIASHLPSNFGGR